MTYVHTKYMLTYVCKRKSLKIMIHNNNDNGCG